MTAKPNQCPSSAVLELLLAEKLSDSELDPVETHVEKCAPCQEHLDQIIARSNGPTAPCASEYAFEPQPQEEFLRRLKQMPLPRTCAAEGEITADAPPPAGDGTGSELGENLSKKRLGQYAILELLGRGNMGVVYKALHTELGKVVALKVLPPSATDEINIVRFKNEARAASRLDHPNIVATHDAGRADGVHFLVMSFVDGTNLAALLQRRGRLSVPDACEAIRQAAVGLQHAFERGLVHRDVKPSNLMLTRDGAVKVVDFGIARSCSDTVAAERLTATGAVLGTADYLAPEQWESPHAADTRADIYSLGATLYHLIAGHPPFSGPMYRSVVAKMRAHLEATVPPITQECPSVPASLAAVVERLLSKDPAKRPATPGEVAEALQPFSTGANLAGLILPVDPGATNAMEVSPLFGTAGTAGTGDTTQPRPLHLEQQPRERGMGRLPVRRVRQVAMALGIVVLGLALIAAIVNWRTQPIPQAPTDSVRIEAMRISQYRGDDKLHSDIVTTIQPILADDVLRIEAQLSAPAYCYFLSFNANGTEQLCYPEDADLEKQIFYPDNKDAAAMVTPPGRLAKFQFPRPKYDFSPENPGLQVLMLIASSEPLPSYAEWRSRADTTPWKKTSSYEQPWRWQFDGQEYLRLPADRGKVVERGGPPREFKELCEFFRGRPGVQAIRALAFPVTKKQ